MAIRGPRAHRSVALALDSLDPLDGDREVLRFDAREARGRPQAAHDPLVVGLHPLPLDALRHGAHLLRVEALLQPREHLIARALRGNAQPAEPRGSHGGQELGRRRGRSEIRRIEVHAQPPAHDGLADGGRMPRRRVEGRVDEIEVTDTGGALQRLLADGNHRIVALSGTSGNSVTSGRRSIAMTVPRLSGSADRCSLVVSTASWGIHAPERMSGTPTYQTSSSTS